MTPVQTAKRIGRGTLKPGNWIQLIQFGVVGVSGYVINLVALKLLVGGGVAELPAQAIAVALAMPFNFIGNKLWTFD